MAASPPVTRSLSPPDRTSDMRIRALLFCLLSLPLVPAAAQQPIKWPALNSVLGVSYPIGELEHTMQFTLDAVAVASRFAGAERNVVAGPGMRLLVLTWNITNIQTFEMPTNGASVGMNPYLETGKRFLPKSTTGFSLPGLSEAAINLKPKETGRFVTVLEIAAEGACKQFAAVMGGGRKAWYDIQKDLAPLPSVFANGTNLGAKAETVIGKRFDLGAFDMVVESSGPVPASGAYQSSASKQFYAVTMTVTNALRVPEKFGWQYATPLLTDADGKELHWASEVIDAATGQPVAPELAPGKSYHVRYVFDAERGRALKQFSLALNTGRTIVVPLH